MCSGVLSRCRCLTLPDEEVSLPLEPQVGSVGLFILKPVAIWLHSDDKYDENAIRPESFGE